MFSFLLSFIASALLTLLVIKESRLHGPALDSDFLGVQKVHAHHVARIGGLSIFLSVALSSTISVWRVPALGNWLFSLLACDTLIAYRIRRKSAAKPVSAVASTSSLQASTPLTAPVARTTEGTV